VAKPPEQNHLEYGGCRSSRARHREPLLDHLPDVTPQLDPKTFTLKALRARLDKVGDLAAPLVDKRGVSLAAALAQLRHP